MIDLSHIAKTYDRGAIAVHALRGVSLKIAPGEFVAIMGPSGSGKSTLMHIIGLLDVPDAGSYRLLGQEVAHLSDDALAALRNRSVGFIFQQFNLIPRVTALENTILPMLYAPGSMHRPRAYELLRQVGLGDRLSHKPNELSGGQQQRVAIARALIHAPPLLLADEPTGNLDSASADEIIAILNQLNRQGMTIVMVTHEPDVAAHARRIIRMKDGQVQSDEPNQPPGRNGAAIAVARTAGVAAIRSGFILKEIPHHFRQAWRALMANKIRTALSMLGILIGVAAVIAMMAIGTGARQSIESSLASMGSNLLVVRPGGHRQQGVALAAGSVTRLTLQDLQDIKASVPYALYVSGSVMGRCQVTFANKNWNTQVIGALPEYAIMHAAQPEIGRFFTIEENQKRARVAVIGLTVARELFGNQNPLGEFIKINKVNFQIIGLLPEKGATGWRDQDDLIVIPLATAMYRLLGREYIDNLEVQIERAEDIEAAQPLIRDLIIKNHHLPPSQQESIEIRNMAEIQAMVTSTTRTMTWLLASIATVSLIVGGIGIMNIMLVSVTERTREIGIRKAVGARRRDILVQFLTEALVVSLAGGGAGILLGWLASQAVSRLAEWPTAVTGASVLLAFGFSALIGVVFGSWPARKASCLNPIDALRYE